MIDIKKRKEKPPPGLNELTEGRRKRRVRTSGTDMVVVSAGSFYNLSQHQGSRAAAHLGI